MNSNDTLINNINNTIQKLNTLKDLSLLYNEQDSLSIEDFYDIQELLDLIEELIQEYTLHLS